MGNKDRKKGMVSPEQEVEPHRDVGWALCGLKGRSIKHNKDVCTQVRVSRYFPRAALLLEEMLWDRQTPK